MIDIDKAWKDYNETKTKDSLILIYAPLVKHVAGRLSLHIGSHVEYEDLVSYGIFGLIDAIDKFDFKKGAKFETYASLRIRGAIIDNIRKLDWVPRTLRQKNKQLEQVFSELEKELQREPTIEEIANRLNISTKETNELIKKYSITSLISLDDYLEQKADVLADRNIDEKNPEKYYEKQELKRILAEAIDKLTEKEKKVITLYYYEDLALKEISRILEISESRVSQIHSKAVFKLQGKLGKYKSILFSS